MSLAPPACGSCRHFNDMARAIEAALPGLVSLGSAFAAVRSADGLCLYHGRYLTSSSTCAAHSARTPESA